jgi:hypothetical protein
MSPHRFDPARRAAIKRLGLGLLGVAAATPVLAQMQHANPQQHQRQHGAGGMGHGSSAPGATPPPAAAGDGHPHAHAVPWHHATCALCDMTLTTPAGAPQGAAFRERTYAQWAFAEGARHFESIGCALGWAYAHGVRDGAGAALYLTPYDAVDPLTAPLIAGRTATFLWAERLPTSMMAKVGAFASEGDVATFVAPRAERLGRVRTLDLALLADLAPLPIANLVPLLQRQLG